MMTAEDIARLTNALANEQRKTGKLRAELKTTVAALKSVSRHLAERNEGTVLETVISDATQTLEEVA